MLLWLNLCQRVRRSLKLSMRTKTAVMLNWGRALTLSLTWTPPTKPPLISWSRCLPPLSLILKAGSLLLLSLRKRNQTKRVAVLAQFRLKSWTSLPMPSQRVLHSTKTMVLSRVSNPLLPRILSSSTKKSSKNNRKSRTNHRSRSTTRR